MTTSSDTLAHELWQPPAGIQHRAIRAIILCIAGSLLLTASAKINIPFVPVPLTLQTLVVLVLGLALGARLAVATTGLYLVQGALGLPVFAKGAGLAYLIGPTGGYLVGFVAAAWALGLLAGRGWGQTWKTALAAMLAGEAIIFALGVGWLALAIGPDKAIAAGLLPFLPGEALKIVVAIAMLPLAWKAARIAR